MQKKIAKSDAVDGIAWKSRNCFECAQTINKCITRANQKKKLRNQQKPIIKRKLKIVFSQAKIILDLWLPFDFFCFIAFLHSPFARQHIFISVKSNFSLCSLCWPTKSEPIKKDSLGKVFAFPPTLQLSISLVLLLLINIVFEKFCLFSNHLF